MTSRLNVNDFSQIAGLSLISLSTLICLFLHQKQPIEENLEDGQVAFELPENVKDFPEPKLTASFLLRHQGHGGSQRRMSGEGGGDNVLDRSNHSTRSHRSQAGLSRIRSTSGDHRISPFPPSVPKPLSSSDLHKTNNNEAIAAANGDGIAFTKSFSHSGDSQQSQQNPHSLSREELSLATLGLEQPMVIAMVGLPARGKSYLVKMLIRYLKWNGFEAQCFNVGSYRRKVGLASPDANFFDAGNTEATNTREKLAMAVQDEMYRWLHETSGAIRRIAIFDATNTTIKRRLALCKRARTENTFLLYLESICDDREILYRNYELKLQNDDYKMMDAISARKDFLSRVAEYEKVYQVC
jgi:hypothetical protein